MVDWASRLKRVRSEMERQRLDCLVLMKPPNSYYVTGFNAIYYSRPVIAVLPLSGEPALIIPLLRVDHAKEETWFEDIRVYVEHPIEGQQPPMDPIAILRDVLKERNVLDGRIGFERDYVTLDMYEQLKGMGARELVDASHMLKRVRMVKDASEIELIRKAAHLTDVGMAAAVQAVRERKTEIDVTLACEIAMAREWAKSFPDIETADFGWAEGGVVRALWCICVSGPRLALLTDSPTDRRIQDGDVVAVGVLATCNGYHAENERTIVVGKPTERQLHYINSVIEARQQSLAILRPGVTCAEVDRASRRAFERTGCTPYIRTRTGHGIGLGNHEAPNFKEGDETLVEENMVVAVEPGLNGMPEVGGVRISDTVLVTKDGFEFLTQYERGLLVV